MNNNKKLAIILTILVGILNVGCKMSKEQQETALNDCFGSNDKNACQALIDNGLASVKKCNEYNCLVIGAIYYQAKKYRVAISYFEKTINLGDDRGYVALGEVYKELKDYFNAKKNYEIGCNKTNKNQAVSCFNLALLYNEGQGVRQDQHKTYELYKKSCDMENAMACNNLGVLYSKGKGVKQNHSIAKQYYGKACDLGEQMGCDNYKQQNEYSVYEKWLKPFVEPLMESLENLL